MKFLHFYELLGCKNENRVFEFLISTLKPSNRQWTHFVNWKKVFRNVNEIEISLNILNYLVGKKDFDKEFKYLLTRHPEVNKAIPLLLVRDGGHTECFDILIDYSDLSLLYKRYNFGIDDVTENDIEEYLEFVTKTGLKDLISNRQITNLKDYIVGVEAGLDSNARKNRGGKIMEDIVEGFVANVCTSHNLTYIKEANAKKIIDTWGITVPVDKSSRRYDFVVRSKNQLYIIETNFYGGGGSKLKSTAGEYRNLFDTLKGKYPFIWITDGQGWISTKNPLRETFNHNDYVFNLAMLEKGILDHVIK